MSDWLAELRAHLADHEAHATRRRLPREGGDELVDLASNDYLRLARHPRIARAARDAIDTCGTGSGASRLLAPPQTRHERAERSFADLKHASAGLLFPTGYMANLAVLRTLPRPGDLICSDKLNHASLIDAAAMSEAEHRVFPHSGLDKLDRLLARHRGRATSAPGERRARRWIVTDAVFSMDGDVAHLPALARIAGERDALLVVDEAHATGVLGPTGAGLAEAEGLAHHVDVTVSTASKALGVLGGVVTAAEPVIETLVNDARPFMYTTAPPPSQAAAIAEAIAVVRAEPWRRERVLALAARLRAALAEQGWTIPVTARTTPIVPVVVGESERALALSRSLARSGLRVPAVRPPTVARGSARLRISLHAELSDELLDRLIAAFADLAKTDTP